MKPLKILTLSLLIGLLVACKKQQPTDPSTYSIYKGGDIITMKGSKPEYVESIVVKNDTIIFTGKLSEAIRITKKKHTIRDLRGNTLLPGLIDAHAHFTYFSAQAIGAQILPPPDAGATDIPSLIEILKKWNTPKNRALTGWIFGSGFDDSVLKEKRFPTKHDLDKVSKEHPIMIVHISGHFAVVNSKGLALLNITEKSKDPDGGIIQREEGSNQPNGILEELAAIPYFDKVLSPKSKAAADKFFEKGQEMALSYGYTTAHEGRAMDNHMMLVNAAEKGKLKLDVVSYVDYNYADKFLNSKWNSKTYKNHYRIGGIKLTLDGSPQGRTAWRTIPYLLIPKGKKEGYKGYPAIKEDSVVIEIYKKAFKNNWQIITHANGDAAIDQMIRTMKIATKTYKNNDKRSVLIHGQYVREDQLDSLKNLDVIASLFPLHTFYWGDWHKKIIGDSLGNKISPTKTALNKGLQVTIHTDAPIALPNLMRMVGISVERKSRSGKIIGQTEKLTPYEALKAITDWSAYQHFEEKTKGTLEKGKLADLVILDKNPLKIPEEDIKYINVVETIKGGVSVYKR